MTEIPGDIKHCNRILDDEKRIHSTYIEQTGKSIELRACPRFITPALRACAVRDPRSRAYKNELKY